MMRLPRIAMLYLCAAADERVRRGAGPGHGFERRAASAGRRAVHAVDARRGAPCGAAGDELAMREVVVPTPETIKLQNVVPPIHFESGVAKYPTARSRSCAAALESVRDQQNVRLHLVGHADNQPLSARLARVYGDNEGLSRERAGEVAELFQKTLGLAAEAIVVRMGRRQQTDRRQRDGGGSRAEPARRGRGLVRRDEGHDGDRGGRRPERHPAGQGLPHRDRLQAALPRRA